MIISLSVKSEVLGDITVTREFDESTKYKEAQEDLEEFLERALKQLRRGYDIQPAF